MDKADMKSSFVRTVYIVGAVEGGREREKRCGIPGLVVLLSGLALQSAFSLFSV